MTPSEFELYQEGQTYRDDFVLDLLSWMQVNLINIHIPRGKRRLKLDKIRPPKPKDRPIGVVEELQREEKQRLEDLEPNIAEPELPSIAEEIKNDTKAVWAVLNAATESYNQQRRARRAEQEHKLYWKSDEGRMMQKMFKSEREWQQMTPSNSSSKRRQRSSKSPFRRRGKN